MTTVTSSLCVWLLVLVVSMTTPVEGFPSGAPAYTCGRMRPSHPFDAMVYSPHTFPYRIDLFADSAVVPMAGDIITVRISGKTDGDLFNGFLATAVDVNRTSVTGFMISPDDHLKAVRCGVVEASGVTHTQKLNTTTHSFRWQIPRDAEKGSQYTIRITVVQFVDIYWVDIPTTLIVGVPLRTNRPDMMSSHPGSTSPNAGSTSRMPANTPRGAAGGEKAPGSSGNNDAEQARPRSMPAAAEQLPSETNEVVGPRVSLPLERTNTLSPRGNRGERGQGLGGRRAGRRGGLAAWLAGWFGR